MTGLRRSASYSDTIEEARRAAARAPTPLLPPSTAVPPMTVRPGWEGETIFHSDWWLDVVAPGQCRKLTVNQGGRVIGELPIWETSKWGVKCCLMPPFTHVFGPVIEVGLFTPMGQLHRRFKITSELLAQIPRIHFFWYGRGHICSGNRRVSGCWVQELAALHRVDRLRRHEQLLELSSKKKTRWVIRRASERFEVEIVDDPEQFVDFYVRNLMGAKLSPRTDMRYFARLHQACKARDCGELFAVRSPDGAMAAAIYLVWGYGRMYYLLSTETGLSRRLGLEVYSSGARCSWRTTAALSSIWTALSASRFSGS